MDYTDIIQDYIDGSLPAGGEEQFFMVLSGNEELRTEFRQQLAIKEAIVGDKKAFTPAPESTMKVFSALGFVPPTVAPVPPTSVAPAATAVKTAGFFSKYAQTILGGLVSTVATAVVVLWLINPMIYGDKNVSAGNKTIVSQTVPQSNVPVVSSTATENNIPAAPAPQRTRTIVKYVYIEKQNESKENVVQNIAVSPEKHENNSLSLSQPVILTQKNISLSNVSSSRPSGIPLTFNLTPLSELISFDKLHFTIESQGSSPWNLQKATINPSQFANFNNSQLGLFYHFNDKLSAGIDVRQETFYQVYEGKDELGRPWRYEQQPNFTAFGATLRYKIADITDWLSPIGQVYLGGTKAGFVSRGMAGAEIRPYYGVSFTIGLEYSDLVYKHQSNIFNAGKIGLKYGMGISF